MHAVEPDRKLSLENHCHLPSSLRKKSYIVKKIPLESTPRLEAQIISNSLACQNDHLKSFEMFPGLVSWKDLDSIFLGCSQKVAQFAGLSSRTEIIGKHDADMIWGKNGYAAIFREEDLECMEGYILYILGKYTYFNSNPGKAPEAKSRERIVLVKKSPILSKGDQILGIINYIGEFLNPTLSNVVNSLMDCGIQITLEILETIKNIFFEKEIALSPREEECAYYTLMGYSAKEIAKKLDLSYRTIECYLSTLKQKLNCRKTSSLIVKMLQLGFLNQIPSHVLLEQMESE